MKNLVFLLILSAARCAAAREKLTVEILDSETSTSSYDVPAKAFCLPSTNGPTCGLRGAETVTVGYVRLKARLNGADIWLSCNSHDRRCAPFKAGNYSADAKGKDHLVLYGWRNPLYKGDFSKADKITFAIGFRTEQPKPDPLGIRPGSTQACTGTNLNDLCDIR